jgi:asparagine synthetase B (glutamine-hydrolysing)
VEYAGSLPPHYLRRGLSTKRILRGAFRDILPQAIQKRGKMGFGVPLGTCFRGSLHDHLGPGARLDEYLDRGAVSRLLDEHARGADELSGQYRIAARERFSIVPLGLDLSAFAASQPTVTAGNAGHAPGVGAHDIFVV